LVPHEPVDAVASGSEFEAPGNGGFTHGIGRDRWDGIAIPEVVLLLFAVQRFYPKKDA